MKWKRIKCFLTGGHRLYDKNLQTIYDTNGYHFINYCVKCGKVFAAFMAEAELNGLIDQVHNFSPNILCTFHNVQRNIS